MIRKPEQKRRADLGMQKVQLITWTFCYIYYHNYQFFMSRFQYDSNLKNEKYFYHVEMKRL